MSKFFIITLAIFATLSYCAEINSCSDKLYIKDGSYLHDAQYTNNIPEPLAYSEATCKGLYTDLYRCCYVRAEDSNGDDIHGCVEITYGNFTEIDDFFDILDNKYLGYEIEQIDCGSSYLVLASLLLFALMF